MSKTKTSILDDPVWTALSDERQKELLEKYRDSMDYAWWDFVYECFKEDCKAIGIHADDIEFTGFWSQGDGASFTGHVQDWTLLLTHLKKEHLITQAKECSWDFNVRRNSGSRYSHSNTMLGEISTNVEQNPHDMEEDPLRYDAWYIANQYLDEYELQELDAELTDFFRGLADKLYSDLEEEYDHLTSDEITVEYILEHANDDELEPETNNDEEETEDATDHTHQLELFS